VKSLPTVPTGDSEALNDLKKRWPNHQECCGVYAPPANAVVRINGKILTVQVIGGIACGGITTQPEFLSNVVKIGTLEHNLRGFHFIDLMPLDLMCRPKSHLRRFRVVAGILNGHMLDWRGARPVRSTRSRSNHE